MLSAGGIKQAIACAEATKKQPSLFSHYLDIKRHNKEMKKDMYPQAVGEIAYTKLLITMDYQQGTFNLALLESKVPKPHSLANYKAIQIKLKLRNVQPTDIIDLHQQASDMLYKGVLQSFATKRKMREMVLKINRQLKQEKIATKATR